MTRSRREGDRTTDWDAVRERLARAARTAGGAGKLSRRQTQQILDERARALAQVPREARAPGRALELVTFTLGGERLALETRYVRAIGREPTITPLPASPDFLLGVTSFRGEIAAVFDIRAALGRPGGAAASHLLFLGRGTVEFAIMADTVDEVIQIPADSVVRRPWRGEASPAEAGGGLTPDALDVIDGAALLDDERFALD